MRNSAKLLLILPAGAIHRYKTGNFKKTLKYAPLTLTYLASLIPDDLNIELKILDEGVQCIEDLDFDPDIVGISVMTGTAKRAYKISEHYRNQGKTVIMGGVHPTLNPNESKHYADSICIGFAERTFSQMLRDYLKGALKPFYVDKTDLPVNKMVIPNRKLLNKKHYITINSMLATRGCPNFCQFCAVPYAWGKKYYTRPINEIINEINQLEGKEIVFIDVHLLGDKQYAIDLMKALIPLNKIWFGLTTSDVLFDDEIIDLLEKSGCKGLLIGFESVSTKVLESMNKSFNNIDKYFTMVRKLHDIGIRVNGTFLFGTDYEDKGVFEKTVEFVDKARIDLPRYSVFTPYPGTPVFNNLKKEGRIITYDWNMYDVEHVVFKPKNMKAEELQEGLHWAWKESYSMRSIVHRIRDTKKMMHLIILTNLGYKYYAHYLPSFSGNKMNDDDLKG